MPRNLENPRLIREAGEEQRRQETDIGVAADPLSDPENHHCGDERNHQRDREYKEDGFEGEASPQRERERVDGNHTGRDPRRWSGGAAKWTREPLSRAHPCVGDVRGLETEGVHIRRFRARDLRLDLLEVLEEEPWVIRHVTGEQRQAHDQSEHQHQAETYGRSGADQRGTARRSAVLDSLSRHQRTF